MILGKVISRVVSSDQLESLPPRPLLTIEPLEGFGDRTPLIAIDSVQAGVGDTVIILQEGTGARQATLTDPNLPMPAQIVIIGIVDRIETR
jgi:microcompartment protein CcmK/EutM